MRPCRLRKDLVVVFANKSSFLLHKFNFLAAYHSWRQRGCEIHLHTAFLSAPGCIYGLEQCLRIAASSTGWSNVYGLEHCLRVGAVSTGWSIVYGLQQYLRIGAVSTDWSSVYGLQQCLRIEAVSTGRSRACGLEHIEPPSKAY